MKKPKAEDCSGGQHFCSSSVPCSGTAKIVFRGLFDCGGSGGACTDCLGGGPPGDCYATYDCEETEGSCVEVNQDLFQEPIKRSVACT